MLKSLQHLPQDLLLPDSNNSQPVDPANNPESTPQSLLFNESPAVPHLDPEFMSNYCDPPSGIQVEKSINHCVKSDFDYSNLQNICTKQVFHLLLKSC